MRAKLNLVANRKKNLYQKQRICLSVLLSEARFRLLDCRCGSSYQNLELLDVTFKQATYILLTSCYFLFTVNNYNLLHFIHNSHLSSRPANNFFYIYILKFCLFTRNTDDLIQNIPILHFILFIHPFMTDTS